MGLHLKEANVCAQWVLEALESRVLLSGADASVELFGAVPSLFVENQGQWADASIRYACQGMAGNVLHTDTGPVVQMLHEEATGDADVVTRQTNVSVIFEGAEAVLPVGVGQAAGGSNYFVGDPSRWRSDVPGFETVAYMGLYGGIDLLTSGQAGGLKYEFHVAPGSDPGQILLTFGGAQNISLDENGALHILTEAGELIDEAPLIYQDTEWGRVEVAGGFELIDADTVGFGITGAYDPAAELVIDPALFWSSFLGGVGEDNTYSVEVDSSGAVLAYGRTNSPEWLPEGGYAGGLYGDMYVVKLSSSGEHLWSTYIGGEGSEWGGGMALDDSDNVFVTAYTTSAGWVSGGFDTEYNSHDVFLLSLDSSGQHRWSTYVGDNAHPGGVDVGPSGDVFVSWSQYSKGYVSRVSASGEELLWQTAIPHGSGYLTGACGVVVNAWGNVFVAGGTGLAGWVSGGYDTTFGGGSGDGFVVSLDGSGEHRWSTYIGGPDDEYARGIAADAAGNVYVSGYTNSDNATGWVSGGYDEVYGGGTDAFVVSLTNAGEHRWSTYLGGDQADGSGGGRHFDGDGGIAVDASGDVLVTGWTRSDGWVSGGFQTNLSWPGETDAFVVSLNGLGEHLWSSYLGGRSVGELGTDIAPAADGYLCVAGGMHPGAAWVRGGWDTHWEYGAEGFVAKIGPNHAPFVANPIADVAVAAGTTATVLDLSAVFDDPDILPHVDEIALSVTGNTNPALLTATVNGTDLALGYAFGATGTAEITVRATDLAGAFAEHTFTVAVVAANHAPVVGDPIPDVTVDEDSPPTTVDLAGTFDDQDIAAWGDALTLSVSANTDPGLVTAGLAGTGLTLSYAPGAYGTAEVTVRATDTGGPASETIVAAFDMDSSIYVPVTQPGFTAVWPGTAYTPERGYGWGDTSAVINSYGYGTGGHALDALLRDFHYGVSDGSFLIDLPNGDYDVTVFAYYPTYVFDLIDVFAEGVLVVDDATSRPGSPVIRTFPVTVSDGQLELTMHDDGGKDARWILSGVLVTQDDPAPAGLFAEDTFTVTVNPTNVAPVAADDAYSVDEDGAIVVGAPGVLVNDGDEDGDVLTAVVESDVEHGTLQLHPDGTFTYTPHPDFNGTDGFTYRAYDGELYSAPATVTITVNAVNDAPVVVAPIDDVTVDEDTDPTVIDLSGVFDDVDVATNGDSLTRSVTGNTNPGLVTAELVGSTLTLTYAADQNGQAEITVTATDTAGATVDDTLLVTVNPVNDAPVVVASIDDVTVDEDPDPTVIDLAGVFNDVDIATNGDSLTFSAVSSDESLVTAAIDGTELTLTYLENRTGSATVTVTATDAQGPVSASDAFAVTVNNLVDLSGRVFDDRDNDGVFDPADGDAGIAGVTVDLLDQATGETIATRATAADGTYSFDDANLGAGTYKIVQTHPAGYLDGKETAGSIGGAVNNGEDSNEIAEIVVGQPGTTPDGSGYNFADLLPSSMQGMVWEDFDDDGEVDVGELVIDGVAIALTGTDDRGQAVNLTQATDSQGIFEFVDLRPGTYAIQETQPTMLGGVPTDFLDGLDVLGEVAEHTPPVPPVILGSDGVVDPVENDRFSQIELVAGSRGLNYNFGERIDGGAMPDHGVTAAIGFWQNKNGQSLIRSLNGGEGSTRLAKWLAQTFPNTYGTAVVHEDTGEYMTNAEVADLYKQLFKRNAKTSPGGPPKLDAQVMAVALATYVSKESLVSVNDATGEADPSLIGGVESYGFVVSAGGVGSAFFNIGDSGEAFEGFSDGEDVQVIDLLLATDSMSVNGVLYDDVDGDGQGDGQIDDWEALLRTLANDVYAAINEQGEI